VSSVPDSGPDLLHAAAPAYDDVEAKRARAGVAAALFGGSPEPAERIRVGRYEIRSRLGAGGMGVVYRAHDPDLDRPVAVKLVHSDSSTDAKARARMLREARALAKLSHPNVITVYDVGTEDEQVFVAMELVAGLDLRRWLERARKSPHTPSADWRRVVELFIAAGRGLAAAHEVALIHRDFKPENVLVGDDGRVRVLDFGLARVHRPVAAATEDEAQAAADATGAGPGERGLLQTSGGLTQTGAMMGTPLYMAPELYAGKPADERSDQFAFCASLYEGVYGQLPFGARTLARHRLAVEAGEVVEPPPDAAAPHALWRLVARGLSPDPAARHPSMASLLAALEVAIAEPAAQRPAQVASWGWLALGGAVLVAAIATVGAGLGLGWFSPTSPSEDPGPTSPPSETQLDVEPEPSPAVDPNPSIPGSLDETETTEAETESTEVEAGTETTGTETTGAETTGAEAGTAEPDVAVPRPHPNVQGWCHLHEDQFTLLDRSNNRRSRFVGRDGQCYVCRVERRPSRTQNFSPRDCAGYSLCGPAAAEDCE
jgi:serine/threonine protein kinase